MPRYIDADKLRKDVLDLPNCYNGFSDTYDKAMIIDLIDEQPTVDAVEVVRCKECKFAHMTYGGECKYCDVWEEEGEMYLDGDFYCAFAERREDGR